MQLLTAPDLSQRGPSAYQTVVVAMLPKSRQSHFHSWIAVIANLHIRKPIRHITLWHKGQYLITIDTKL